MSKWLALWIACIGLLAVGMILGRLMLPNSIRLVEVADKFEFEDKCYIETYIEVTTEEYIGLDIGDEYEVKK